MPPPDLLAILDAIRDRPDAETAWEALSAWPADNGRDDEAAAVRVFWPVFRDNVTVAGMPLGLTLRELARNATALGRQAREVEQRVSDWLADE